MPTATRRLVWTPEQWTDFGGRCRALLDRITALLRGFPETPGLRARDLNQLARAHGMLADAAWSVEGLYERQWIATHRGALDFPPSWGRIATDGTFWLPVRGRVRTGRPLSRAEWAGLGREAKAIRDEAVALGMDLQTVQGATKALVRKFIIVADKPLSQFRCRMDSLVCQQHPDWPDAIRVFYGQDEPDLNTFDRFASGLIRYPDGAPRNALGDC